MQLEMRELEPIIAAIQIKVVQDIIFANRMGELEMMLEHFNLEQEQEKEAHTINKNAKVIVLGHLGAKKDDLRAIAKKYGLKGDCLEFVEYENVTGFDFKKLEYTTAYCDVFIGPVPHSATNMGDYGGVITKLQTESEKYPQITLLKDTAGSLKITKTSFKEAIENSKKFKECG